MNKKIKFYLDQNVIDYLIKGKLESISEFINQINNSEIIYSYVTLREFSRINDESNRNLYLNYLKNQNAKYFWIDDNEKAHFEEADPFLKYVDNRDNDRIYGSIEKSMYDLMHKFLGGKKDITFNEIGQSQKTSFNDLIKNLDTMINSFKYFPDDDKKTVQENIREMKNQYSNIIDKSVNDFSKNSILKDTSPLNELRKLWKIDVSKLKNIEAPNIVEKIWEIIKDGIKSNNIKLSYDDLFGDVLSKFYPNIKVTMIMKINGLYNLLNSLGYYPDKNISNDKKFIPFINDHQHVGHAIYADFLITRDNNLMKKAEAIFEHYNIGTKIIFIKT